MAIPAIRFMGGVAFKAASRWVLKQDIEALSNEFEDAVVQVADKAIDRSLETALKDHVEAEENIEALKGSLRELAEESKIVIFVDELDRCRPNFAVNILESIKHIFDVEGVQFVLVLNANQLRESITHCYGGGQDEALKYLDKFIGFSFSLPSKLKEPSNNGVHYSYLHALAAIKSEKLFENSLIHRDEITELLSDLFVANNTSLREAETFVRHLKIYQIVTGGAGLSSGKVLGYAIFRVFAIFLYCFHKNIVNDLMAGNHVEIKVSEILNIKKLSNLGECRISMKEVVLASILFQREALPANHPLVPQGENQSPALWKECIANFFEHGHRSKVNKIMIDAVQTLQLNS